MRKRIQVYALMVGVGIWAFCGMCTQFGECAEKKLVRISSGSAGGVYQILGSGMAKIISERAPDLDVTAITPANINQVPQLMQSGQTVAGIGMADMMDRALNGTGEYKGKKYDKVLPLFGMYDNLMAYVALKSSSITKFKEIQGKRAAVPSAATKSQVEAVVKRLMKTPCEPLTGTIRSGKWAKLLQIHILVKPNPLGVPHTIRFFMGVRMPILR
ncbi:MAG: hypothetical protein NTY64_16440 [Deltaproteobacteria bacterium]|nr:hypothetical protein [Deltaproteobacteria bacterium]